MFRIAAATKCIDVLDTKLKQFGLSLENDIVCITTAGAAFMKKVATLIIANQQLCFVYGIHLAVIKILHTRSTGFINAANIETEAELKTDKKWKYNRRSNDGFED